MSGPEVTQVLRTARKVKADYTLTSRRAVEVAMAIVKPTSRFSRGQRANVIAVLQMEAAPHA